MDNNLLQSLKVEFFSYRKIIYFQFFISLCALLPLFYVSDSKQQLFVTFTCAVILFLSSFINKLLFVSLSLILLIPSIVLCHLIRQWGEDTLTSRVQAAYLSPTYESIEYVQNFFTSTDYLLILYIGLFILVSFIYLYKVKIKFGALNRLSVILVVLAIFCSQQVWFFNLQHPFKFIQAINEAGKWKSLVDERLNYLERRKPVQQESVKTPYDKIVLILGESVNKDHMGVYGYEKPTTPFYTKLSKSKNFYKFNNAISPSNQTRFSIPMLLTGASVDNFKSFTTSASILSYFKDLGYQSYWFSNQYISGMHDSYIATIASEANVTKVANFVYESGGNADSSYDEILIKYLRSTNIQVVSKEFYVLHMLGSHFQYNKRYPRGYGLYPEPKNKVEMYDNSIAYSDNIIEQVHPFFTKSKTLFIYLADHGQVINYDESGHGFHNPSYRDEFTIPFILYSTVDNANLDSFYQKYKNTLINMESLHSLIAHLAAGAKEQISNDSRVISIDPMNIIDFNSILHYGETNLDTRSPD